MKITKYIRLPFILFLVFFVAGIIAEMLLLQNDNATTDMNNVSRSLHQKLLKVENVINDAGKKLENLDKKSPEEIFTALSEYNTLLKQDELSLQIFKNDTLVYWSDNVTSFTNKIANAEEGLLQLPNGWVTVSKTKVNDYSIYGLVILKYVYNINNNYLGNKFVKGFNLPNNYEIQFFKSKHSYPLYDLNNSYLFSIKPAGNIPCMYQNLYIPLLLFMAALFAFFVLIYRLNSRLFIKHPKIKLLAIFILLSGIFLLSSIYNIPKSIHLLNFFSPSHFAYSTVLSSLGDFLLLCLLIFFWGICFARTFNLTQKLKQNKIKRVTLLSLALSFSALLLIATRFLIKILILNSNISMAVYRIEEITIHSFAGLLIIGLLCFTYFFIIIRISRIFKSHTSLIEFSSTLIVVYGLISLLLIFLDKSGDYRINLFFGIVAIVGFYISKKNTLNHRLSLIVVFTSIYTIAALSLIVRFDEKHEQQIQTLLAMNLTSEHDPTVELFLHDIDAIIKSDTFLIQELYPPFDFVASYLDQTYFRGYFREYEIQYTICQSNDSLIIKPENIKEPCLPFFDSLLVTNGYNIAGTNFHFLENMNGRKTYLGKYSFDFNDTRSTTSVFIELNSRLLSEGTGFPELLLPANSIEKRITNNYSFAKYNNKKLVDRGGEYTYALNINAYDSIISAGATFKKMGQLHTLLLSVEQQRCDSSKPPCL